jgi:hypothetical protein
MVLVIFRFWPFLLLPFASRAAESLVRHVDDEASFVSALKSGVEIIVVKNHLDLFCERYEGRKDQLNPISGKNRDKNCDSTDLPADQLIADSTRAIVVRVRAAQIFIFSDVAC